MKKIRLYHNQNCSDCARLARLTQALDWLDRVEISTEVPPTGALGLGEIAVQELRSGEVFLGIAATRAVCRQVPAYFLYRAVTRAAVRLEWVIADYRARNRAWSRGVSR